MIHAVNSQDIEYLLTTRHHSHSLLTVTVTVTLQLLQETLKMDNPTFTSEEHPPPYDAYAVEMGSAKPQTSYNRYLAYEKRVGMAEAMEELRQKIGPDVFSAPLNQGELTGKDKLSLAFLILFPTTFFLLGIILTSVL